MRLYGYLTGSAMILVACLLLSVMISTMNENIIIQEPIATSITGEIIYQTKVVAFPLLEFLSLSILTTLFLIGGAITIVLGDISYSLDKIAGKKKRRRR